MKRTLTLLSPLMLLVLGCSQAAGPAGPSSMPPPVAAPSTLVSPPPSIEPGRSDSAGLPGASVPSAPAPSEAPPRGSPADAPVMLAVGEHAQVVTDNLRRRSMPEVSAAAVIRDELLQPGAGLWILDGPVEGSGYWWYRVALAGPTGMESSPDKGIGWVASADLDGTPWIAGQPFEETMPTDALVWSSRGETVPTQATFTLPAGAPHIIFSGIEDCLYRVQFGTALEFDLGFRGAQLSTVKWPSGPEPSMATWGQGTGVTAMPSLPAGTYQLEVSNTGAPMIEPASSPDHACPWGLAITP